MRKYARRESGIISIRLNKFQILCVNKEILRMDM